jgi:hypothetical protein
MFSSIIATGSLLLILTILSLILINGGQLTVYEYSHIIIILEIVMTVVFLSVTAYSVVRKIRRLPAKPDIDLIL